MFINLSLNNHVAGTLLYVIGFCISFDFTSHILVKKEDSKKEDHEYKFSGMELMEKRINKIVQTKYWNTESLTLLIEWLSGFFFAPFDINQLLFRHTVKNYQKLTIFTVFVDILTKKWGAAVNSYGTSFFPTYVKR